MKTKLILIALVSLLAINVVAPVVRAIPATGPWYQPRSGDHKPLILAHQGGEGEYPSNTMLAFTKAYNAKADALDTDMFATKDGVLVLFHDETLDHRTNCTGAIGDKTYAELLQCDFAYNWTPDGGATYPYRGKGIKVATAQELLTKFPNARIGLEIKQTTQQAALDLCALIQKNNAQNRMLISSFAQPNMDVFRWVCPSVATSATQDEVVAFLGYMNNGFPPGFNPAYSSFQVPDGVVTYSNFVDVVHFLGMKVYAWTIDTPEQTQHFIDKNVDGVNTSYPKRIINWLGSPLKSCASLGITFKLTNPPMDHGCVWVMKGWLNEARDKYDQENNPAWPLQPSTTIYDAQMRDGVIVWQYIQAGKLPVNGEADPATINNMSLACVAAETTYGYNSALC